MVWTPPYNGRQQMAEEALPVDTTQEERRKAITIKEEPSDGLHEKQKHERNARRFFGVWECIDGSKFTDDDENDNNNSLL